MNVIGALIFFTSSVNLSPPELSADYPNASMQKKSVGNSKMNSGVLDEERECIREIVSTLNAFDTLSHEEIRITATETRSSVSAKYQEASSKKAIVVRVPPDRSEVALWKNGKLRLESIAIGNQIWNREPGERWELQPQSLPDEKNGLGDTSATRLSQVQKQLSEHIKAPRCNGEVEFNGQRAMHYSYDLPQARVQLWVDKVTNAPIKEVTLIESGELNARTTVTRDFRYDETLTVVAPE